MWNAITTAVIRSTSKAGLEVRDNVTERTLRPPPMVKVRYRQYEDRVDLTGKDIISICGASRAAAKVLFHFLTEPSGMQEREFTTEQATAYNGDVADEVHEFKNATQGRTRITRLLLRDGEVIELTLGSGKM